MPQEIQGCNVAYASQMLTNSTPETLPSFTDVDMRASAAGCIQYTRFSDMQVK